MKHLRNVSKNFFYAVPKSMNEFWWFYEMRVDDSFLFFYSLLKNHLCYVYIYIIINVERKEKSLLEILVFMNIYLKEKKDCLLGKGETDNNVDYGRWWRIFMSLRFYEFTTPKDFGCTRRSKIFVRKDTQNSSSRAEPHHDISRSNFHNDIL